MLVYLEQFYVYPRHGVTCCGQENHCSCPGLCAKVAAEGVGGDDEGACVANQREEDYDVAIHAVE
jgi:hypothetical protein